MFVFVLYVKNVDGKNVGVCDVFEYDYRTLAYPLSDVVQCAVLVTNSATVVRSYCCNSYGGRLTFRNFYQKGDIGNYDISPSEEPGKAVSP
jgi:hypothetical protein